ncbi:hypothetical protein JCM15519_18420 [Fundidesulfovibrio butyratiphilus]
MNAAPVSPGLWSWKLGAFAERVAVNDACDQAALALGDGRVAVIDLPDGQARFLDVHRGSALGVVAHPGKGFVSAGDDGRLVRLGPDDTQTELVRNPGVWFEPLVSGQGGAILAVGAGKDALMVDLVSGVVRSLGPHAAAVTGLAVSPAGAVLAVGYAGGVSLWDLDEGGEPATIAWPGGNRAMAFSPDGKYLACANQDRAVHVLDLEAQNVFTLAGLPASATQLAWTGDSRCLLTTGAGAVLLWPVPECFNENPSPLVAAAQEESALVAVAVNPGIPFVAAGFDNGRVVLVETVRLAALDLDHQFAAPVSCLAWSRDGRRLICADEDGDVVALDLAALLASE